MITITKYTAKNCTRDAILDNALSMVDLPSKVESIYLEDLSIEEFYKRGIKFIPSLVFDNGEKNIILYGDISSSHVQKAIEDLT